MTPATLVHSLRHRGIRLEAEGSRLHYVGPVTAAELALLRQHKAEVLRLLTGDGTKPTAGEASEPTGPCGLCGSPLVWVEGWPTASDARWLCPTCAAWPARSLAEVFAMLTSDERTRLDAEATEGDALAAVVLAEVGLGTEVPDSEHRKTA